LTCFCFSSLIIFRIRELTEAKEQIQRLNQRISTLEKVITFWTFFDSFSISETTTRDNNVGFHFRC
jgi:hypothetical protein